ncbi:PREDICTED: polycystin-1, partial [Condylura cristata]|uniref:polycystin-1 n=1 Tax=Condylura cristata TaxID=143302 RepID=UPI000642D5C1
RAQAPGGRYYLNLSSRFRWSALEVSVGLYSSLCQYFSEEDMAWRTEGLVPLDATSPRQAVCLTRHLTAFGASLFVPPSRVHFIFPEPTSTVNYVVLLTCTVCLVTYAVMVVVLRKLDQLDVSRVRVIPFCGQGGRFKYEILLHSPRPVSRLTPPGVDAVAVGLVSSVVVYPVYLVILFLFRMSRSKVAGGRGAVGRQVPESDSRLDSALDSSFLTSTGPQAEAFAGQVTGDLFLGDSKSLVCWPSSEATLSWPDLLSDPCIVGSALQRLAQGAEDEGLSLTSPSSPAKYFAASDEALARQSPAPSQDTQGDTDLLGGLCGTPGEKTEALMLQRLGQKGLPGPGLSWEQPLPATLPKRGLVEGMRRRLLPAWCAALAHGLSLLLVAVAVGVSGWVGAGFPPRVSVTWLLSSSSSFLASFLGWEPLKVLLEALYFSLVARRLHPDEDDTLVESPAVAPVSERVPRVRPPHGFALFLAKEEARKVKRLHGTLRSLLVYMLFLLVTLLANYGDASHHSHAYHLQSAIKQELDSRAFLAITRSDEFWPWMSHVLLPSVHENQSSPELGPLRLRQVRLQEALCPDAPGPASRPCVPASGAFSTSDYGVGWGSAAHAPSEVWAYSAPDLLGAWYWGYCAVYDSGGYVQELGPGLEQSRARLAFLRQHGWIDNRSRAVFVELTRYSPAVGLHAAVTLRLEFPESGRAMAALSVRPFALRRLSAGLSLPLLTSVSPPGPCPAASWRLPPLLCAGLWALRLWGALRLGSVLLRWRYHALRGELYRPAWEPQDYEMVELFLRRLRLWMGFSKVKEPD